MKTLFISTGEISGDRHGAKLVTALKKQNPDLQFVGMGGPAMKAAGVRILEDLTPYSTMGFIEPFKYIRKFLKAGRTLKTYLKTQKPDIVVTIDFQGFHMILLKTVKKLGIPSVYYIAPQEWQWGTEKGGRLVLDRVTKLLCIFQKEAEFYTKLNPKKVRYVGHPLIDMVGSQKSKSEFLAAAHLKEERPIISIFAGSRKQEYELVAPILIEAAKRIQQEMDKKGTPIQICISVVHERYLDKAKQLAQQVQLTDYQIYTGPSYDLMQYATLSLAACGTIILEHAMMKTPTLVAYKLSPLSYRFLRFFFGKKIDALKYASLPNLLEDRIIYPEFLQADCSAENMSKAAMKLLTHPEEMARMKTELETVSKHLGKPGVVDRAATEILQLVLQ